MKRRQFLAAAIAAAASTELTVTLLSNGSEVQLRLLRHNVWTSRTKHGEVTSVNILYQDGQGQQEWMECSAKAGEDALRLIMREMDNYLSRKYGSHYSFRNFSHWKRRLVHV